MSEYNSKYPEYNPNAIEKKWQKVWDDNKTFHSEVDKTKKKYYPLVEFPYPSGQGLHVGHPRPYTALDIVARKRRLEGYSVMYPMGFDAFGLPTENYAIKNKIHPAKVTEENIKNFKEQLKSIGFSFDWDREVNTTDPEYYKWTQWIFIQLYKHGLAYKNEMSVNWCPSCQVGLANEEVVDGKCERCGTEVVHKMKNQWMLKITEYADRLLEDLDELDWPESIKDMQRNWIGRSEGAKVTFKIEQSDQNIEVFTTRPDTIYGTSFLVLSPEHPLVNEITTSDKEQEVKMYQNEASKKSDLERTDLAKEKTGVFTGAFAINPLSGDKLPIWIADYVLSTYGTGAVMAVPGHDERDHEFATKFNLPIIEVIEGGEVQKNAYTGEGKHINSGELDGLENEAAISKAIELLESKGAGEKKVNYKLRDWLFSRQRYWGEPIPIIHWEDGSMTTVPEDELPLLLPETDEIKPSGTGESPLANIDAFVNVIDEKTGMKGRRETNTMPQWAGSCWYYLRYIDPHNEKMIADPEKLKHWLPVDLYIGGVEHAVLHLLYARFWHKVLYDLGVVPTKEPFQKLYNQGMILGEGNEKMSKSKGNVINPDDIVASHGADTLRLYEMFMGPLDAAIAWSEKGLDGSRRFLDRVWRLIITDENSINKKIVDSNDHSLDKVYNQTVKKVTEDFDTLSFNTAISQLMVFINECYKTNEVYKPYIEGFVKMLAPIAPHIGEELWDRLGHENTITYQPWPTFDESLLVDDEVEIVVQVNGKVRAKINIPKDLSKEEMQDLALSNDNVKMSIEGKEVKKVIAVPQKLVNIVAK
mgnify:CR=1 FL=1